MKRFAGLLIVAVCLVGCKIIDDDLSVCGVDYDLLYEMKLVTNVQMTVDEKLGDVTEKAIADSLKQWLAPIFSGQAHDLHMNFYATDATGELRQNRYEIINASQKSYTLYIPREDYLHMAIVNTDENTNINIEGDAYAPALRVAQRTGDTLVSHQTAVYTARLPMSMSDSASHSFNVNLYMISCAVALAITQPATEIPPIRLLLGGTATGFNVRDSVFTYTHQSFIRAERVMNRCYAMVALPSKDAISAGAMPAKKQTASSSLWELKAYVTLPDGTVTETILTVDTPLQAGTLEIIKVQLNDDGSLVPVQTTHVGASVTLDWKEGTTHEVEI